MTAPTLKVQIQGQGTVSADDYNTYEQTCGTFADLRAFIGAEGVQVSVRGQSAVNDGNGGVFYWNASGTGPDDIDNIVPPGAAVGCWTRLDTLVDPGAFTFTQAGANAITRTMQNKVRESFSVTDFGTDSAAFQSAINELIVLGGGTLIIPYGTYTLTSGVVLGSNITLQGLGYPVINNIYDGVLFNIPNAAHNITFDGITFSGIAKQHIGTNGNSGANNLRFLNCNFTGCTLSTATSVYLTSVLLDTVSYVYVDKCAFYGNGRGVDPSADNNDFMLSYNGGANDHIFITNSRFISTQVTVNLSCYNCNHLYIDGNECSGALTYPSLGAGGYGILVYNASILAMNYVNIRNNFVHNTGGSGIYVAGIGNWWNVENNIIDRTTLTQLDVSLPASGISLNGAIIFNATGNTVSNSTQNGITVAAASNGAIVGNTVYNCGANQIYLRGTCSTISVTGNDCYNGKTDDILVTAGTAITISGNTLVSGGRGSASINALSLTASTVGSNTISGAYKIGIAVQAGASNSINGNSVLDSSTSASNSFDGISNSATNTIISNNNSGNTGSTGARYGIVSGANDCTISGNLCLANKTGGLSLSGTNLNRFGNRVSTDPIAGSSVLVGGTSTVATAEVQTGDLVNLTCTGAGGTQGIVRVSTITAGTSFVLTSSQGADTSTYQWRIEH